MRQATIYTLAGVGASPVPIGLRLPTTRWSHGSTMIYWHDATGDSLIVTGLLVAAVLSAGLGSARSFRGTSIAAGLVASLACASEALPGDAGGEALSGITDGLAWGWAVILPGAALLMLAGFVRSERAAPSRGNPPEGSSCG